MARAKVGQRFTVVLPKEVRTGLAIDDPIDVVRREDGVIELRPQRLIDARQAWFWTESWQRGERDVDEDYAAGRFRVYDSTEEFIAALTTRGPVELTPDLSLDENE